ncbi:whey acidic protein-like [Rhinophrynus dorsalis]
MEAIYKQLSITSLKELIIARGSDHDQHKREGYCPSDWNCPSDPENNQCDSDYDCTAFHKCCPTTCGRQCLLANTGSKPGQCPPERYFNSSYADKCVALCTDDSSCTGDKKCCPDNCYKFCKPPAKERPGKCPKEDSIGEKRCNDFCTSDSECANGSKCCFSKCGKTCVPIKKDKKGICPEKRVYCFAPVRDICFSDTTCPDKEKCCPKGCRTTCQNPIQG